VGAPAANARQVGGPHGAGLFHAANAAFITGADRGVLVAAAATFVGMIVAARALRAGAVPPDQAVGS